MHYRTIFLSDIHLGTRSCRSDLLLQFLHDNTCDNLYLVGDIIDVIALKQKFYWPQDHSTVIQKILRMSRKGTNVTYIPGNHDEDLRHIIPLDFGGIKIVGKAEHILLSGDKMLLIHGDAFDSLVGNKFGKYLAKLGTHAYDFLIGVNVILNWFRKKLGLGYWSLANYLKSKVKNAMIYVNNFEEIVVEAAKSDGYTYVLCGHIHQVAIKQINDVTYINTGTWQDDATAILEHEDGRLESYQG